MSNDKKVIGSIHLEDCDDVHIDSQVTADLKAIVLLRCHHVKFTNGSSQGINEKEQKSQ